ncbi:hypothetical protein H0A36_19425 [Endozoicomonas sp. SM1973]|uniref:Lipoprotein n=1 Tax=Spartinivicinus marinus TaxID=2994442 RepID=A0A853I4A5_9GAMM|nr:hypothetical protein [Spartinivicinus marinus]MCX4027562.1 hypothetical protein [Spartinivicinus marinus]NYZ68193.1 hypothetical protein [Spartinivicinus marinus]
MKNTISFLALVSSILAGCTYTNYSLDTARQAKVGWKYSYSSPTITYVKQASLQNNRLLSLCFAAKESDNHSQREFTYTIDLAESNIENNSSVKSDFFTIHEMNNLEFYEGCEIAANDENNIPVLETAPRKLTQLTKNLNKTTLYLVKKNNPRYNYLALSSSQPIIHDYKTVLLKVKKLKKINGISVDKEILWYAAVPFAAIADTATALGYVVMGICSHTDPTTEGDPRFEDNNPCLGGF